MEKSGLIAIVVALIGAGGVIGAKLLEIAPKPVAPAPVAPPVATPVSATTSATPAATPPAEPAAAAKTPDAPAIPAIAGTWVDQGGLPYLVTQDGATFRENGTFNGITVVGQGAIIDRQVRWTYQNSTGGSGQCAGALQPGDRAMTVSCQQMNGPPYMMQLTRAG